MAKKKQTSLADLEQFQDEDVSNELEQPLLIRIKNAIFDKYDFQYNEIRQILEFRRKNDKEFKDFEHEHLNTLWIEFQLNKDFRGRGEKPSISLLEIILYSHFTKKFHPMKNYFESLKWDKNDHITTLANTVQIADVKLSDDTPLVLHWEKMFRRWLISCVSCGMGKSINHVMLLFVGAQGTYKTTWMNRLCPAEIDNYGFTGHINPELTDNTTADLLAEKFIINIDDQLQSIFDKDMHRIKGIITATSVTNRKSYRRDSKKRPRIANFVGSVNKDTIFQDIENRRYLTFKIDTINIKTKVDINQVWAQAYELYKQGERHWFNSEEIEIINRINDVFAMVSHEEEWLLKLYKSVPEDCALADVKFVMFSEITTNLQKASGMRIRHGHIQNAMKKLKWHEKISKRINGEPRYVYAVIENFKYDQYAGKIILNEVEETKTEQITIY